MSNSNTQLGPLIYSFFEDQLKCQKGLRPSSIRSYRDALQLFLLFVAEDTKRKLSRISLTDLTGERVRRFLNFLEQKRHNQVRTRNHRLAAIRSFFEYLATREPMILSEAQQVASIPVKRTSPPQTFYLEHDEVNTIFSTLPSSGLLALRDHALLLFLYNTGARVQEAADLRVAHLELSRQPRVRLHGKGDKWRLCPLWQTDPLSKSKPSCFTIVATTDQLTTFWRGISPTSMLVNSIRTLLETNSTNNRSYK